MKYLRYVRALGYNLRHPLKLETGPIHLQIEVSTFCNLACVMCPHPTMIKNPRHMTLAQFRKVFDTLQPLKISLSGLGEPFLNPEMLAIIRYASQNGAATITTSNLTVITPELARGIVQSGLGLLKGSIDSTNSETYLAVRQRDMHAQVLQALENLRNAKRELGATTPAVRLQFVMQRSNFREIPHILDLSREYGVDAVNFQPLELATEEFVDEALVADLVGDMDKDEFRDILELSAAKAKQSGVATNLNSLFRDFEGVWAKYRLRKCPDPPSAICLMPWSSVYITVDGDVRPCCSFPLTTEATLGNIFTDDFMQVWNSPRYQGLRKSFRQGKRPFKICRNCLAPTLSRLVKSSGFAKYMMR